MGLIKQANRPLPTRYDYVINEHDTDKSKDFGSDITLNDILLAKGPDAVDYTDISATARRFFAETTDSLSEDLNPFYDMIARSGGIKDIEHDFVRWKLFGKPERELRSTGNPNQVIPKCGLGGRGPGGAPVKFKIRLDNRHLKPGNTVAPIVNKSCIIKIVSTCSPGASGYEYEATSWDGDTIPKEMLKAGMVFIKLAPHTGKDNPGEAGGTQFNTGFSYIQFEVALSTFKWEYTITEGAWRAAKYYKIGKCASGDQSADPFANGMNLTSLIEEKIKQSIRSETEMWHVYGRSTRNQVDSITGDVEMASPGLMEYMEQSQKLSYTPTVNGLDKMTKDLIGLQFDRQGINSSKRNWTFYTGMGGLELFSCWVEEKVGATAIMTMEDSLLKTSTPIEGGRTAKAFMPYQYVKYYFPWFGSISVKYWPLLDNTKVNGVCMPGDYKPISSYEFWAFEGGGNPVTGGQSNIMLLRNKTKDYSYYRTGTIGPNGRVGLQNPIFKQPVLQNFAGYKYEYVTSQGLIVLNPQKAIIVRPDICI